MRAKRCSNCYYGLGEPFNICERHAPRICGNDVCQWDVPEFAYSRCGEWRADIKKGDLQQHTTNKARQPRKSSGEA
jgi:hypothetical protein